MIAKTGTAEFGDKPPLPTHAWMVAGRGDLAVAVFVERGESGSQTAGPDPRAVPARGPMSDSRRRRTRYRTFRAGRPVAAGRVRRRRTARVLLVDDDGRMLLF